MLQKRAYTSIHPLLGDSHLACILHLGGGRLPPILVSRLGYCIPEIAISQRRRDHSGSLQRVAFGLGGHAVGVRRGTSGKRCLRLSRPKPRHF
jgi:hypothetical protein